MDDFEDDLKALTAERNDLAAKLSRETNETEKRRLQDRLRVIEVEILAREEGEDA